MPGDEDIPAVDTGDLPDPDNWLDGLGEEM